MRPCAAILVCRRHAEAYASSNELLWSLLLTLAVSLAWMLVMRCWPFDRLRSDIDKLLGSDRILCLVVALETALADERYEVRQESFSKLSHRTSLWFAIPLLQSAARLSKADA